MKDTVAQGASSVCALADIRPVIDLSRHAVLRGAAWPIETVAPFEAPGLAQAASETLAAERQVLEGRDATVGALHAAVPAFQERKTRAYLLAAKRQVFGDTAPLPAPSATVAEDIAADVRLREVLAEEQARRQDLQDRRAAFERLHDEVLERQRRALRTATGTPRFRKALIIANPLVAGRWEPSDEPGSQSARVRRIEATVFHYLMRAAGRPTPHGAWAGVAPVLPADPSDDSSDAALLTVTPSAPRHDVTLNLLPFTVMLGKLASLPRYRRGYPLRLNPTCHAVEEGWRYEREAGGVTDWMTLEPHPLHRLILDYFADGEARPVEPLLDALERASDSSPRLRGALEQLVDTLLDRDVLRSDLGLPPTAPSVWEALDAAIARLVEPDRALWAGTVGRIRALCRRLGDEFDILEPAEVDALRRSVEGEVQGLWEATGFPGTVAAPLLRLDLRLPLTVRWGRALRDAATRTVGDLLAFHAADGGAELLRRMSLRDVIRACGTDEPISLLTVLSDGRLGWSVRGVPQLDPEDADPTGAPDTRETILGTRRPDDQFAEAARAHCLAWEGVLEPVHAQSAYTLPMPAATVTAPPGPGGAMLLRLAAADDLWFAWGRPEPAMFASRFVEILRDPSGGEFPLFGELRAWAASAAQAGVTPIEIVGWVPLDPNVAVRGETTHAILDPHGPPELSLRGVQASVDPDTLRPWLRGPQAPGLLAPVYQTAAALGFHDRCQRLLLQLARGHGWELLGHGIPASLAERTRWGHRPRLRLPGEVIAAPERWTVLKETVSRLAGLRGAERYLEWRRLVEERALPALVHARGGPLDDELLVRTDSPLAVRCLLDSVGARAPWLELTELPGDPAAWPIQDAAGQHYFGELAVVWHADDYWATVAPAAPPPMAEQPSGAQAVQESGPESVHGAGPSSAQDGDDA